MSQVRKRKGYSEKSKQEKEVIFEESEDTKSSPGLLTTCFLASLYTVGVLLAVAAFGYYRCPFTALSTNDFSQHVELDGVFQTNERLTKGTKIYGITGAESIDEDKEGNLYTGLADGRIVRISPSKEGVIGEGVVTNITTGVIPNIAKSIESTSHGRPLGLRVVQNTLFVADAVYGIYSINLQTNALTSLVAPDTVNPRLGLADDLCISKDRNFIYFSDGCSKYSLDQVAEQILEGVCDGRILQYNIRTKEIRTVMSNLCFANGVQLSSDEKLLFVSELLKYRVRVIDMTTWKTKQFIDVPIPPDNIRPTGKGTYWVAGVTPWTPSYGFMERNPIVRQIVTGLFGSNRIANGILSKHNILLEMTEDGEVLQTLHDPEEELIIHLTQVSTLSDGRLVLGSYRANFLAILDEKNAAIGLQ